MFCVSFQIIKFENKRPFILKMHTPISVQCCRVTATSYQQGLFSTLMPVAHTQTHTHTTLQFLISLVKAMVMRLGKSSTIIIIKNKTKFFPYLSETSSVNPVRNQQKAKMKCSILFLDLLPLYSGKTFHLLWQKRGMTHKH